MARAPRQWKPTQGNGNVASAALSCAGSAAGAPRIG